MWNGTTATLKPNPARRKTIATMSGASIRGLEVTTRPSPETPGSPFNTERSVRDCPGPAIEADPATP